MGTFLRKHIFSAGVERLKVMAVVSRRGERKKLMWEGAAGQHAAPLLLCPLQVCVCQTAADGHSSSMMAT